MNGEESSRGSLTDRMKASVGSSHEEWTRKYLASNHEGSCNQNFLDPASCHEGQRPYWRVAKSCNVNGRRERAMIRHAYLGRDVIPVP